MNIPLKEKIAGMLYGFAIGDALGLGTEFMTKQIVGIKYPDGLKHYSQIVRDAHRSQWERGQWSNDTNYLLTLIESMVGTESFDPLDYARRLAKWYSNDLFDITQCMRWVLSQPDFANNPYNVSRRVWRDMQDIGNPSDALGRALLAGVWDENVYQNAIDITRLTHPRPRCETAAVLIAHVANNLLWNERTPDYEEIRDMAVRENREVVMYVDMANENDLGLFDLDDPDTCWYARKAMGSALWSLWHAESPEHALFTVINEGGDADTNAAIAFSLIGLRDGVKAIPAEYIDGLVNGERIAEAADKLTALLEKRFVKH